MEKPKFNASVLYDEPTIKELCKVVCDTYCKRSPIIISSLSIFMIVCGIWIGLENASGFLLSAFGCLMLPNINYHQKALTKQMLAVMAEWHPTIHYSFTEENIITDSGREVTKTPYGHIISLTRAMEYDYLFISKSSAIMIDMRNMNLTERDTLETFLVTKTGLAFKKYPVAWTRFF